MKLPQLFCKRPPMPMWYWIICWTLWVGFVIAWWADYDRLWRFRLAPLYIATFSMLYMPFAYKQSQQRGQPYPLLPIVCFGILAAWMLWTAVR